jgi:tRNA pseudouridine38-40 synthase
VPGARPAAPGQSIEQLQDPRQLEMFTEFPVPVDSSRVRMTLAYDGSSFRGFAYQPGQRTVAGEVARAMSNFCRHDVELVCAGRTDSGVHAQGQVVHADIDRAVDPEALKRAVNRQLSPSVVVLSAERAPKGFDARRSATARSYRYLVLQSEEPDPLLSRIAWHIGETLDRRAMNAGADALLGEHDFSAFCRRPPGHPRGAPITRRVTSAEWRVDKSLTAGREGEFMLRFEISATSFCHQMVRSVVGALVEIGRGRSKPSDIPRLLESGDRTGVKTLAPPKGLCLMKVAYGDYADGSSVGKVAGEGGAGAGNAGATGDEGKAGGAE